MPEVPPPILHRCHNCKELDVARCTPLRRGKRTALHWCLEAYGEKGDLGKEPDVEDSATAVWGPSILWVPTELQQKQQPSPSAASEPAQDATLEELGEHWGPLGAEWAWAHDGSRQNGWVRLLSGGALTSKWGTGTWRLLQVQAETPPLLLVTFHEVEHALRLNGPRSRFDIIAKRRLQNERSLAEDVGSPGYLAAVNPLTEPCCPTRGWSAPGASP